MDHDYGGKANVRFCIDELAGLAHPRDGHRKIFAMIDAYLDESGIHDGAPICVIAGYFGGRGQWRKFEKDWREALKKADVPLEKFHAKNLIKRVGFFLGWKDAQYFSLLSDLAEAICRYKIYPIFHSVIVADFFSFPEGARKWLTGATVRAVDGKVMTSGCPSKPYFMPFQYALRNICGYAPAGGKAHFFFGLDRPFAEYARFLYAYIKEGVDMPHKDRLGTPAFPLAKETPQLQAADYLAYLGYLHAQERMANRSFAASPPEPHLNSILQRVKDKRTDLTYIDRDSIGRMLQKMPALK